MFIYIIKGFNLNTLMMYIFLHI